MLEGKVKVWNTEMSTNVKRATRKGLLPDYYSNISDYIQYYSRIFFKNFFCSSLFSLQHGGQIRSSSCVTSRESALLECDCIACSSFMITSLLQVVNKFDVSCFEFANIKLHQVWFSQTSYDFMKQTCTVSQATMFAQNTPRWTQERQVLSNIHLCICFWIWGELVADFISSRANLRCFQWQAKW